LAFTPGYAPPEQYRASGATDARTDLYGLGASLFYLLTGYQPTEAPARLGALAVPPLRQLNPAISALTEAAVVRAMELIPEQRQQSALELERDLRAARTALAAHQDQRTPGEQPGLVCAACGTANPPETRHCARCGAAVPHPDAAPEASPRPRATAPLRTGAPITTPDGTTVAPHAFDQAGASAAAEALAQRPAVPTPAPDSEPDQPVMALPPLRPGPAPAAQPLAASAPARGTSVRRQAPLQRLAPARAPRVAVAAAAGGAINPAMKAAFWSFALPSLRRWQAQTVTAALPVDDAEVRAGLAGVLSVVLAVCTLLSVRAPAAMLLAVPALALGHWSHRATADGALPEARWLATLGLAITYVWLTLYIAGWLALNLRAWL
jgi:hypothetical protein